MVPNDMSDIEGRELTAAESDGSVVALLNKGEVDMQITTAHRFPRSVKGFRDEVMAMSTLSESVAEECTYALPRDGKTIIGPSARFGEIVASAWGNSHVGARIVDDAGDFVTAQAVFWDLQRNYRITYEVRRRIVDKKGRRFSADMIGVTGNAACSIALRNAILKGVPKAFWSDLWEKSRQVAIGDVSTLANRRAKAVERFQAFGITEAQICAKLGKPSMDDVTPDDLGVLLGLLTAIKDGDVTPEAAFAVAGEEQVATSGAQAAKDAIRAATGKAAPKAESGAASASKPEGGADASTKPAEAPSGPKQADADPFAPREPGQEG